MKKVFSSLLSLLLVLTLSAQNFEGKIVYQNSYKSKHQAITDAQWAEMAGNRQEYFIKGGDYRSTMNGSLISWQLYINKENKLYNKLASSETVFWNDGSENKDEVLDHQLNKGVMEILGYWCDELILTTKNGTQKYYFSPKLGADYQLFAQHQYGNWAAFLQKTHALPLKQVLETPELVMESVAIEVTPMALEASSFQLPAGTKTAQSPY